MQIKCPICGEICESDVMPDIGQHVLCPFCNGKFQYSGEHLAPQPQTKVLMRVHNAPPRQVTTIRRAHKFCRECGSEVSLNAAICPNCGVPVAGTKLAANGGVKVPNHMVEAILITLFCCMIFGIIAIVYASQVNTKLAQGDVAGAQAASRTAYGWIIAGLCVGLVVGLLYFAFGVLSAM